MTTNNHFNPRSYGYYTKCQLHCYKHYNHPLYKTNNNNNKNSAVVKTQVVRGKHFI